MKKLLKNLKIKLAGFYLNILHNFFPGKAVELSFKFFLTPAKGKINYKEEAFLNTASSTHQIDVEGQKLRYYFWKAGEKKVLLAHGWESNSLRWKELIQKLLEENFSVISLDAPAHGSSEGEFSNVPLYGKAIVHLVKKYSVDFAVGHSLGGFTLLFQQQKGGISALQKLVLLAPAIEMKNIVLGFQQTLGLKNKLMKDFEKRFEEEFEYNLSDFSITKLIQDNPIPTLFIHDRKDRIVHYSESENLVDQWGKAQLKLTENLGHGLRSQEVDEAIIQYLKEAVFEAAQSINS